MAALVILLVIVLIAVCVSYDPQRPRSVNQARTMVQRHEVRRRLQLTQLRTQLRADAARARRELDEDLDTFSDEDQP